MKTKACLFFTEGRREAAKIQTCSRPAKRGAKAPPWSDLPLLPICERCIDNTNWPSELLVGL